MDRRHILRRLHHRPPFLFIDEVLSHSATALHALATPTLNDFYLQGHFPHVAVVPGSMMQEMTTQAAGLLIAEHFSPVPDYDSETTTGFALGVLRAVHFAKYKKFARPHQQLHIHIELVEHFEGTFRCKGRIESGGEKIMANEFTLINISEAQLIG